MQTIESNSNNVQLASEIVTRIKNLESLFAQPLKDEMTSLKLCLLENASACSLLLPEDVGLLVQNLRRTVSAAAIEAATTKKPKASKTALTKEQIEKAMEEEGF